jgi:hypothetical protein
MKTVYDSKTGEPITLNKVDANERLAAGLATATPKPVESVEVSVEPKTRRSNSVKDDE